MAEHLPSDNGVPEDAPRSGAWGFLVVALLALVIEVGTVAAWALGALAWGWIGYAAVHLLLSAALLGWTIHRRRRGIDQRFAGLLAVTTTFLGPSGPFCTLLCGVAYGLFSRYATGFHDWYLSLFPENETAPAEELYELIVSGREQAGAATVVSFSDIMTVGDPQQKQAVIALVARHFRPIFTPALKLGLADSDPSVRVQAATATARVEHEFNERWLKLIRVVESNPDKAGPHHALARHLDDYAFCGLLDSNREEELRRKAEEYYRTSLDMAPNDSQIRNDLGRLLLRVGKNEEAAAVLAPVAVQSNDRRLLAWYAESLFRLRRFDDLRQLCVTRRAVLATTGDTYDALSDVVDLWIGGDIPPEEKKPRGQDASIVGVAA